MTTYNCPPLLVVGGPGAGKTTLLRGLVELLTPEDTAVLCGAELPEPNCECVQGVTTAGCLGALTVACTVLDQRKASGKDDSFSPFWVIVDDYDALVLSSGKFKSPVLRLLREGPAFAVRVVLSTQLTTSRILSKELLSLMPDRAVLRVSDAATAARLGAPGAEELPAHGFCAYVQSGQNEPVCIEIPKI